MRVQRAQLFFNFICLIILSILKAAEVEIYTEEMSQIIKDHMKVLAVRTAQVAHPTGDPNFSVMQPFPAAFTAQECDPFLMCDAFGPVVSSGIETNPDKFQVQWHPHRGMDLLTYITEGVGRHADSLGNRGEFASPGMQWISAVRFTIPLFTIVSFLLISCTASEYRAVESSTLKAEARLPERTLADFKSGTQLQSHSPFNIDLLPLTLVFFPSTKIYRVNVPSERKMDDPRYGTEPPENLPVVSVGAPNVNNKSFTRVLAGSYEGKTGPFKTVTEVQILDFTLTAGTEVAHHVPAQLDNCLLYVYKGSVTISHSTNVGTHQCARFDASDPDSSRLFTISAAEGASFLLFTGKMLKQPIAWHGPFVMTTDAEIRATIREYQQGTFLKKRAAWDYKRIATKF